MSFSDFEIDPKQKQIVCCGTWGKKLVRFNMEGKLLHEDKLDFSPTEIAIKDSFYYFQIVHDRINPYHFVITDQNFNILKRAIKFEKGKSKGSYNRDFVTYKENLFVCISGVDTIFELNGLEMEPYVCFNLGEDVKQEKRSDFFKVNALYYFNENDKFLRVNVRYKTKKYTAIFDKSKQKRSVVLGNRYGNDFDYKLNEIIYFSHPQIGDVLVKTGGFLQKKLGKEILKQNYYKPTKRFVNIVKQGYDPNDNPLLVILK